MPSTATAQPGTTTADQRQLLLLRLAERLSRLNPESATIGGGMLASLVTDARRALGQEGGAA